MSGWADYGFPDHVRGGNPMTVLSGLVLAVRERASVVSRSDILDDLPEIGRGAPLTLHTAGDSVRSWQQAIYRALTQLCTGSAALRFVDEGVYDRGIWTASDDLAASEAGPLNPRNTPVWAQGRGRRFYADWALAVYEFLNRLHVARFADPVLSGGSVVTGTPAGYEFSTRETVDGHYRYTVRTVPEIIAKLRSDGSQSTTGSLIYIADDSRADDFFVGVEFAMTVPTEILDAADVVVDPPDGAVFTDAAGRSRVLRFNTVRPYGSCRIDSARPVSGDLGPGAVLQRQRLMVRRLTGAGHWAPWTTHRPLWIEEDFNIAWQDGALHELPLTLGPVDWSSAGSGIAYGKIRDHFLADPAAMSEWPGYWGYYGIHFDGDLIADLADNFTFKPEEEE